MGRGAESKGCNAKEGNPFGPFWDTFNVDFIGSEFYNPLNYDVYHSNMSEQWNAKYPPSDWPGKLIVLIFFPRKSTSALDQQLLSVISRRLVLRSLRWGLLIIPIPSNTISWCWFKTLTQNVKGICDKHMNLI